MDPIRQGKKLLFGEDATNYSVGKLRGKGVVFIPESPLQMAVVPWFPVLLNSVLTRTSRYAQKGGFSMNWGAARRDLSESYKNLGFTPPSFYTQAKSLSGGNLQRLIIARELTFSPRLILASYLTRGLDVQSAVAARQALLTARGDRGGGSIHIRRPGRALQPLRPSCRPVRGQDRWRIQPH